jgi:hypothetical protein
MSRLVALAGSIEIEDRKPLDQPLRREYLDIAPRITHGPLLCATVQRRATAGLAHHGPFFYPLSRVLGYVRLWVDRGVGRG